MVQRVLNFWFTWREKRSSLTVFLKPPRIRVQGVRGVKGDASLVPPGVTWDQTSQAVVFFGNRPILTSQVGVAT